MTDPTPAVQPPLDQVLACIAAGQLAQAAQHFNALPQPTSDGPGGASATQRQQTARYFLAAGILHGAQRTASALQTAQVLLERGLGWDRSDDLLYHRGVMARQIGYASSHGMHSQLAEARRYFQELLQRHGGEPALTPQSAPLALAALRELSHIAERIGPVDECHRLLLRLGMIDPQDPRVQAALAESGALLGTAAVATFDAATPSRLRRFSRYPDQAFFDGASPDILRALCADTDDVAPFLTPDSRFFCIGSCFAREIGSHLRKQDFDVTVTEIGEAVNNSFTNLMLLRYLSTGQCEPRYQDVLDKLLGHGGGIAALRQKLAESDVVVFTLGVAPAFFDDTGAPVLVDASAGTAAAMARRHSFRTTTVDENLANMRQIVDLLQSVGKPKRIVLTVSPVPLRASFEYRSAVVVDMLLRERGGTDLLYWPSFEMVRWVSGHRGRVFGVDDDAPAHISYQLVGDIVATFTRRFSQADAAVMPHTLAA